jgi:hypothetical protein
MQNCADQVYQVWVWPLFPLALRSCWWLFGDLDWCCTFVLICSLGLSLISMRSDFPSHFHPQRWQCLGSCSRSLWLQGSFESVWLCNLIAYTCCWLFLLLIFCVKTWRLMPNDAKMERSWRCQGISGCWCKASSSLGPLLDSMQCACSTEATATEHLHLFGRCLRSRLVHCAGSPSSFSSWSMCPGMQKVHLGHGTGPLLAPWAW